MPGVPTLYKYYIENAVAQVIDSDDSISSCRLSYIGNGYFIMSTSSALKLYRFTNGVEIELVKTIYAIAFLETVYGCAYDGKFVYAVHTSDITPGPTLMKFDLNTNQKIDKPYLIEYYIAIDGDKIYSVKQNAAGSDLLYERDFYTGEQLRVTNLTAFSEDVQDICTDDKYIYVLADGALPGSSQIGKYDKETLTPIDYWGVILSKGIMTDGMYFYVTK